MPVTIDITDSATSLLDRANLAANPLGAMRAVSSGVARLFRGHFRGLSGSNRNKWGAKSTGFWQRMGAGVTEVATATQAAISMPREVAQRRWGGKITPVNSNWLTLPARAEAYGKRAREFSFLRFAVFHQADGGAPVFALVDTARTDLRGKGGKRKSIAGGKVYFWLRKSVNQKADESILPKDEEIMRVAKDSIGAFLMRQGRRSA